MLDCQKLKETIQNFRERYSFLEGELLNFKETGEMSEKTKKELEKLKKEFDEFEEREIGERVKGLEEAWEKNKTKMMRIMTVEIEFSETPHFLLERVLNQFIEGFREKEYPTFELGHFISEFINKNIDFYIEREEFKGKKIEEIKEVPIRLNVKELKYPLSNLGYHNREKCHLIIYGDCGNLTGSGMSGGEIEVKGNCRKLTSNEMSGGKIKVYGDCEIGTGADMSGGTLIILGEVEGFARSAFSSSNNGQIWHKGEKIWPK